MTRLLAIVIVFGSASLSFAQPRNVVKPIDQGPLPYRVHVFEDYETEIERKWWLRTEMEKKDVPKSLCSILNSACAKAVESKDFDDKQGDPKITYKAVVFNPVPGPPMGKNTRLSFRYKLKGTDTLRVQIYSLSNGYHRHLTLTGLKQGDWQAATVDMAQARRPDGTGGALSEDERIDDIQFYIDKAADLWIDDIVLYDAAAEGEKRPFPKRIIYTGWFDTGKQGEGTEWPGKFEIVKHEKPLTWKAARSVIDERTGRPQIIVDLRGERPMGVKNKLRFRYHLKGADMMMVSLFSATTNAIANQTARGLKTGEWVELELDFKGSGNKPESGTSVSEIRFAPLSSPATIKDAVLMVDDVLLFEPGE